MSLHPFLKQISPSRQLAVHTNIMQSLINEVTPQYSPSPRKSYQSSSDDWRSECSTPQSGGTYTVIKILFETPTLQQELF